MPRVTAAMKQDFERFLEEMDFLFEDLEGALAGTPYAGGVAFDDASLARIERFYLDVLAGRLKTRLTPQRLDRIMVAFYGEAVRERAGRGTWVLSEAGESFGTPVLAGWADGAIDFSPVISRELQKADGQPFIVGTVEYAANRDSIHASFFDEFE